MIRYSLVLLAAAAVFSGCSEDECCYSGIAPTAVIAEADNRTVVAGVAMAFTGAASSDSDGTVQGYSWTVDGAEVAQGSGGVQALNHTFATAGNHEVCLVVTDNDDLNSENKECRTVVVAAAPTNRPPVASFALPVTCNAGESISVNGSATDADGDGISNYMWTGADSAAGNPNTVTCPASGETKRVCLSVKDDSGAANDSSTQVCRNITANTVTTPAFGLLYIQPTGTDGYNILCSSDGSAENNITFGSGTDIKEVYWDITYHIPGDTQTTSWTQTEWNTDRAPRDGVPDAVAPEAVHFCGKWVGKANWDPVGEIDITANVLNNSDVNTTYEFTIDASGNISQTN